MPETVTVTATYIGADEEMLDGEVEFRPSAPMLDAAGDLIVAQVPIVAIVTNGVMSVELVATDFTGVQPDGVTYEVQELLGTRPRKRKYSIELSKDLGVTVDLADITPAVAAPSFFRTGIGLVHYNNNAGKARPLGYDGVLWVGFEDIEPANAEDLDLIVQYAPLPPPPPGAPPALDYKACYWADDPNIVVASNVVTDWVDRSGNGFHANASTTARKATFVPAAAAFNNRGVLRFNGTANCYAVTAWPQLSQPLTAVAFVHCTSLATADQPIFQTLSTTNALRVALSANRASKRAYWAGKATGDPYVLGDAADTNLHLYVLVIDGANSYLEVDGVVVASGDPGPGVMTSLRIGANNTPNQFFTGDMAYLAFLEGEISSADKQEIVDWVGDEYSFPIP